MAVCSFTLDSGFERKPWCSKPYTERIRQMTATTALTWDDVLKREDLVGGDIESVEDGVAYRGPLAKIEADGDTIRFTSPWCARMNGSEWENWHITSSFVTKEVPPQDIGDGRVHFSMPFLGACTIFPKGGSKLDPHKVKGLPLASERLLALYPDLPLDRDKAKAVLTERSFSHQVEALAELPAEATLGDLLSKFRADSSKEEFLWFYIEAVKGEKDVHQKVY